MMLAGAVAAPPAFAVGSMTWIGTAECGAGVTGCSALLGTISVLAFIALAAALVAVVVGIRLRLRVRRRGLQGSVPRGLEAQATARNGHAVGSVWCASAAWVLFVIAAIGGFFGLLTIGWLAWSAGFGAAIVAMRALDVRSGQSPSAATRRWALTGLWMGLVVVPCTALTAFAVVGALRP